MTNKSFGPGILLLALLFGIMVAGCNNGVSEGPGSGADPALNGTWVSGSLEWRLNNGNSETSIFGVAGYNGPTTKGTYSTNGNNFYGTTTHYHGNYIAAIVPGSNPGSGWVTAEQSYSIFENYYRSLGWSEGQINTQMNSLREKWMTTYSITGNSLTLTQTRTSDGYISETTYTKR